jgi:signal peptidase II
MPVLKRWGLLIVIAGTVLLLDQSFKQLVIKNLSLGKSWIPIPALESFIQITRSHNTGAAFGMFPFASDIFLILAFVTIAAFIISYPRLPSHAWLSRISIALISGGALSNALDRLLFGHVVDYVHVQVTSTLSNVSNFADHAISVGVVLLLIDQWRAEQREKAEAALLETETDSLTAGLAASDAALDSSPFPVDDSSTIKPAAES